MKSFFLTIFLFVLFFGVRAQDKVVFFDFNSPAFRVANPGDFDNYLYAGKAFFAIKLDDLNIELPLEVKREAYLGEGIFMVSSSADFFKQMPNNNSFKT